MPGHTRITSGSIPKYRQLLIILRNKILTGTIGPGERLPPEEELASAYHVSRGTVRRAIAQLEAERLIETTHGLGSFVRQVHPSTIPFRFLDPGCFLGDRGATAYKTLVQESLAAPMEVAERLRIPFGVSVIHIARQMVVDGHVTAYSERYLLEEVMPSLVEEDLSQVPFLHELLVTASEFPLLRAEIEIEAHILGEEELPLLEANPGETAILINRLTFTAPNRPAVWYTGLFKNAYYLGIEVCDNMS
jgi:GntR family transcriptional regulator